MLSCFDKRRAMSGVSAKKKAVHMDFQCNTDNNIDGSREMADSIESGLRSTLSRHVDQLTRLIVHVREETEDRYTATLEARIEGQQPQAVTASGGSVEGVAHDAGRHRTTRGSGGGHLRDRRVLRGGN